MKKCVQRGQRRSRCKSGRRRMTEDLGRGLRPPHSIFTNSDFTNPDFAGLPDKLSVRSESISLSRCSLDAVARFAQAKDLRCRAIYRPAFQATETLRAAMRARADPSGTAARCSVSNAAPKPARPKTAFASTAAVAGPPTRRSKISITLLQITGHT